MRNGKKPKGIPLDSSIITVPKPLGSDVKPKKLVLPLHNRWGMLKLLVRPGKDVSRGQLLAEDERGVAPPVYSPCDGKVLGVRAWSNFAGEEVPAIILQCSGSTVQEQAQKDTGAWKKTDPHTLVKKVQKAGIRETDAYVWPLAWRLAQPGLPPTEIPNGPDISRPIEYLIVNALDRQPGVTIRESALSGRETEIAEAISLLEHISGTRNTILAVRKGQPISDSLERELRQRGIKVRMCPPVYPIALEPILVQYITGREIVLPHGDARAVGVTVVDILTALRVYRSIRDNSPAFSSPLQLTIHGSENDYQTWIPEGILVSELLEQLQFNYSNAAKLILGGPLLGFAQHTFDVPITAEVDNIIIQAKPDVFIYENNSCINCGYCVKVCPMGLMPNELSRLCEYENFEAAERQFLFHCIECGLCAYICPARRPMVQLMRFGKREIGKLREASQEQ